MFNPNCSRPTWGFTVILTDGQYDSAIGAAE